MYIFEDVYDYNSKVKQKHKNKTSYLESSIRASSNFSETTQARQWNKILSVKRKKKKKKLVSLYLGKLSFKHKGGRDFIRKTKTG